MEDDDELAANPIGYLLEWEKSVQQPEKVKLYVWWNGEPVAIWGTPIVSNGAD